ncbi:hypothetical protein STCU_02588 [Strigomonas culicis]|uniref:Lipid/polyisoprenoid-binding YceI-like domain-containing protein n=1 Tax=Strigomonas culicis TaxID=28005 RepID=S9W0A9_9TRYP|nr:hypothetical protein STCU_02588 [Strigomonas culicis]|eukprot:EPY32896.1 hypothetical protein STCU_02588 [Strigomonas culicis]
MPSFPWRGDRRLSSERELAAVDMYVYTQPAGLLGRLVGRALRFRVERFLVDLGRDGALPRVEVDAESLRPQCEVYPTTKFERAPLGYAEVERLQRRTRGYTLDAPRYPTITFDTTASREDAVEGVLCLRGASQPIRCTKAVEGAEVVVRCPLSLAAFNVPRYSLWLGLFSVSDAVEVETRIPSKTILSL